MYKNKRFARKKGLSIKLMKLCLFFFLYKLWPETDVAVKIVRKFQFYNDIIVVFTNWLLNFCS